MRENKALTYYLFHHPMHTEFLKWIDLQINLHMQGNKTVVEHIANNFTLNYPYRCLEDMICNVIIEAFTNFRTIESLICHLRFIWPEPLTTKGYADHLLHIPLEILSVMIKVTEDPSLCDGFTCDSNYQS